MKSTYNESDFYYTDKIANEFYDKCVGMNTFVFPEDNGYYPNVSEAIYFNGSWGILEENHWGHLPDTIQVLFSIRQEIIIKDMGNAYLITIEGVI